MSILGEWLIAGILFVLGGDYELVRHDRGQVLMIYSPEMSRTEFERVLQGLKLRR